MSDDRMTVQVPARYSRVDPWVISADTDAEIAFLEAAFGGRETPGSRMLGPGGRIGHVEVMIGDAVLMMFDARPEWPPYPAHHGCTWPMRGTLTSGRWSPGRERSPAPLTWRSESASPGSVTRKGTCGGFINASRTSHPAS